MWSQQFQIGRKLEYNSVMGGGGGVTEKKVNAEAKYSLFFFHDSRWIAKINYKQLWKKKKKILNFSIES